MTPHHIRQSNLIEGVDNQQEDIRGLVIWNRIIKWDWSPELPTFTHGEIMARLWPNIAGNYRHVNVQVGDFLAPRWQDVESMMQEWCADMDDWKNLDPKDMHIRFEKIHPFRDGNGRAGRMLMWWHESKLGLEPTLIEQVNVNEYYKWFE